MSDDKPLKTRLDADAGDVLAVLPAMGRLMITARGNGVTHERIGAVTSVTVEDGWIVCRGAEHDSGIELAAIDRLVVDRSGRMGDRAFPRIDLHGKDGEVICSAVGFEGLEPFDAALAPFGVGETLAAEPDEPAPSRGEATDDDPGATPFHAAREAGLATTIRFRKPGFVQSWEGVVEAVKPAMGFINVMRPDFHLHLRAGAVRRWRSAGSEEIAEDADGRDLGLVVIRKA